MSGWLGPLVLTALGCGTAAALLRRSRAAAVPLAVAAACLLTAAVLPPLAQATLVTVTGTTLVPAAVLAVVAGGPPRGRGARVTLAAGAGLSVLSAVVATSGPQPAMVVRIVAVFVVLVGLVAAGAGTGPLDQDLRVRALWVTLGVGFAGAAVFAVAVLVPAGAAAWAGAVALLAVPACLVVAVVAPHAGDPRRIIATTVVHGVTGLGVVAGYSGVLAVVELGTGAPAGRTASATLVLLAAVVFHPLRTALRPLVDTVLFGRHLDPLPVVVTLGRELGGSGSVDTWLAALLRTTGLPWAELRSGDTLLARAGATPTGDGRADPVSTPLLMDGELVGVLELGRERPGTGLHPDTTLVLALLATPLAHAVRSARLATDLQASRERIAGAREGERRRLQHDLHDGLGPTLTGLGYSAEAAARMVRSDPDAAVAVLGTLRTDTLAALAEVHRIVAGLRPPELDGAGLAGAVLAFADRLTSPALVVTTSTADLPAVPPALELAVYRIVTEALTNVARHSTAARVEVTLAVRAGVLTVTVLDDGDSAAWTPGVGLTSMRERAEELGGTLVAGPGPDGGRVEALLPVAVGTAREVA